MAEVPAMPEDRRGEKSHVSDEPIRFGLALTSRLMSKQSKRSDNGKFAVQ